MSIPVFDLHCDILLRWKLFNQDVRGHLLGGRRGQKRNLLPHTDIPRLADSSFRGLLAGVHSFISKQGSEAAFRTLLRQVRHLQWLARERPNSWALHTPGQTWDLTEKLPLSVAPAIEGAHMLNADHPQMDELAALGVVAVTLAHNRGNWAVPNGFIPGIARNNLYTPGLEVSAYSTAGRRLVEGLVARGIAIDVAHVAGSAVREVIAHVKSLASQRGIPRIPVLCTHAGARFTDPDLTVKPTGINFDAFAEGDMEDSPTRKDPAFRNISRHNARLIAETGGVIGVYVPPMFLGSGTDSQRVFEHVKAMAAVAGPEHVAIGTDYDGMIDLPKDHRDCRDFGKIATLITDYFGTKLAAGILHENASRALNEIWACRDAAIRDEAERLGAEKLRLFEG